MIDFGFMFFISSFVMRTIYLPELINIKVKNFTLYPNGLNFSYDFVKGVNLILGGNGMGKTTFVNIIKFGVIGHYKKNYDYIRTYKEKGIARRRTYPENYFKNRMDPQIQKNGNASIVITFKFNDTLFTLERNLENVELTLLKVNDEIIEGKIISDIKYEDLKEENKIDYLQYKYEEFVKKKSGINFDDLIFFVTEILFFGEDHKTILWNDGFNGFNVQDELFSKYFINPELDQERQEALRQAKYYDSLSRHKSEDIRAIRKILVRIQEKNNNVDSGANLKIGILEIKDKILECESKIDKIRKAWLVNSTSASISQNMINELSLKVNDLEREKNKFDRDLKVSKWENLNPYYEKFLENIKKNHVCPMCNKIHNEFYLKVVDESNNCFTCGTELMPLKNKVTNEYYEKISEECKKIYVEIQNHQLTIKNIDQDELNSKSQLNKYEAEKRGLLKKLRELEYKNTKDDDGGDVQVIYDEIKKLENEKEHLQRKSIECQEKAKEILEDIEKQIEKNTNQLSSLFSNFAEKFLGVRCELTFDKLNGHPKKRLYPKINGSLRISEDELSESQRFFIDHSFRMSILSFFYTKPAFYMVETPDSSLDISYEENAAKVFLEFLANPNCLIITSNLNNSSFINYIIDKNMQVDISMIGLLDIAKKSVIQNTNSNLIELYESIKVKIKGNNHVL